jgi:ribose transport system permease protein
VLVLLCGIVAAVNPNFLTFNNAVRISQAAMIPLVLGLGATFIILMGSIDLSVEGVLALGAVMLSLLSPTAPTATTTGSSACSSSCWPAPAWAR